MDLQPMPSDFASSYQPVMQPCDCGMEECDECFNLALQLEDEAARADVSHSINQIEDDVYSCRFDGTDDDDDSDEEDGHGSRPINDPEAIDSAH